MNAEAKSEDSAGMEKLVVQLRTVVGDAGILTGDDVYARPDSWPAEESCQADILLRPANTEEVAAVLRLCHAARQPVVAHGGLTGLVNGARTRPGDVVLSLERMRRVESIDPLNRSMVVQAGVVLQKVHEAAEEHGLAFPLDLGARGSATIGGNIATNAGGNGVIRYGMTREQVLGLEVVLADGTVLSSMNSVIKNNTGYDLKQLFIGSEGTLGVITRAVLRLRPKPRSRNTALVATTDFPRVSRFLSQMEAALGGSLSAFEVMWNNFYSMVVGDGKAHGMPLETSHPFYILLEARGSNEDIDRTSFERALEEAFEKDLIVDAVIAQSDQQRNELWAIRDDIDELAEKLKHPITFDVSMNISDMDAYVKEVEAGLIEQFPQAQMVFFGHIGDGNIHPVVSVGSLQDEAVRAVEEIVYGALRSRGGVISAEHGIGLSKRPFLEMARNPTELALMRQLKQTLDPHNLLNPGKIFDMSKEET